MTGEVIGAAAGAILATGVATCAGVRLHRQMPIVTWRAWVTGFPLKPVAWALAAAVTLTLVATAVVGLVTAVSRRDHQAAAALGDHPSPAAGPVTTSEPPRPPRTPHASRATSAVSAASYPPSPRRSVDPSRDPSPGHSPYPPSPSTTPLAAPTPTPSPTSTQVADPTPSPTSTQVADPTPSPTSTQVADSTPTSSTATPVLATTATPTPATTATPARSATVTASPPPAAALYPTGLRSP